MAMQISNGIQIAGGVQVSTWNPIIPSYLYTWGSDYYGQLGNGNSVRTNSTSSPATVIAGGTTWNQITCGYGHVAGIKTDGTLWTWGGNPYGQLGNGSVAQTSSPNTTVAGGNTWSQLGGGDMHIAAIKTDGTLWTWGFNSKGQLGQNLGSGNNTVSPNSVINGGTTWVSVSRGAGYVTGAIKSDGTLWTCGYGYAGATARGTTADTSSLATVAGGGTTWIQVATGYMHTAAVKTDGTLWTCGYNRYGQLGDGTVTSKTSFATVAGGGTTWRQVACGLYYTAAVKTDGTLWTWGYNASGGLGNNTTTNTSSPGTVAGGGTNWASIAPSSRTMAAAIKTDGTLWTWGENPLGGLGNGTTANSSSPGTVAGGGTTWTQVACGSKHTAAARA